MTTTHPVAPTADRHHLDPAVDPNSERVLVVDDNEDIRALISVILSRAGYRPETADGGIPALAAAQRQAPELYVLDVDMPGMTGLDLCRHLKADHRTHAPVLIVSANATDDSIAASHAAGADAYLTKPFTRRDLLDRVNHLLQAALTAQAA